MPRGLGSVYQRGSVWWVRYSVAGRELRESSGSEDRDDALRLLKKRMGETAGIRERGGFVTFDGLRAMLVDDYRLNERASLPRAELALEKLRAAFGGEKAERISSDKLTRYAQQRRAEGASPATVKMELAILRRAMRLAARAGKLDRLPVFPTITVRNVRSGFLEVDRFEAVLAALPPWAQPVILFLFLTGWRKGDALGLQWRQVDLEHGSILLEKGTTKNRDGRVLPFRALPALDVLIRDQRTATDETERQRKRIIPWVFHRDGHNITASVLTHTWNDARAAAGAPGAKMHDFRRTAARRYVRAQVNEKAAMQLLGMKTRSIFDRYNIVGETEMAEALKRVSDCAGTVQVLPRNDPEAARVTGRRGQRKELKRNG